MRKLSNQAIGRIGILAIATLLIFSASAGAVSIYPAGVDRWATQAGSGVVDFSVPIPSTFPIPADFFDPGSDPFNGSVELNGNPVGPGNTDTAIERLSDLDLPDPIPATDQVPIELVALSLKSIQPITVTSNGGYNPEDWDVSLDLSDFIGPTSGVLQADKTHVNGGTYNATFSVTPVFIFTRVSNPLDIRFLSVSSDMIIEGPWLDTPVPGGVGTGPNFFPGTSTLQLYATGSTSVYYDDVLLEATAIPEPASVLLLGSGLIGLIGFSRRKKSA